MQLFSPFHLGDLSLHNRLVMAPMTRCRATGNLANTLMADYYAQRAGAGLIVTEGTSPSPDGLGYARIPALFTGEQAAAWRQVTTAVHDAGGRIFVQLMHAGRVGHPLNLPDGAELLAPSPVPFSGDMWTDQQGNLPCGTPRELTEAEIRRVIDEFAAAARLAIGAGFDGVELHGANGYLLNQFLDTGSNRRADRYGGSPANRNRFVLEVAAATAAEIGKERTGIRLSPHGTFNGMSDDPELAAQFAELATGLGEIGLVYVHLVDQSALGLPKPQAKTVDAVRSRFRASNPAGAVILNGGYDLELANAALAGGAADLIAFGRPYIANPDLPLRLQRGLPLAMPDEATYYSPGAAGYTDYPVAVAG